MIYLDNAATTPLDPLVFEVMKPYLLEHFGNPSSAHAKGRQVKVALEAARKSIAKLLNCNASQLFFNSGATEGNNTIIKGAVQKFGIKHIISSRIEHHAVLHPIQHLEIEGGVEVHWVKHSSNGAVDLKHLEELLRNNSDVLVSIMHGNNELGIINPLEQIATLCQKYNALFHADTVQTVAHLKIDLSVVPIHFITASAHKFHGPKGVGFMYMKKDFRVQPLFEGGAQEKEFRAGTENISGIMGMAKAFEIAHESLDEKEVYLGHLKTFFVDELAAKLPFVSVNAVNTDTLENIISLSIPEEKVGAMLLFSLDMRGVMLSGGSACSSGAVKSHVATALGLDDATIIVRISLSRFNTKEELIDFLQVLQEAVK